MLFWIRAPCRLLQPAKREPKFPSACRDRSCRCNMLFFFFFFPGRYCLHSKIKCTWKISWAIRATGSSRATSMLGTCLDAGWLYANCQMGMNPGPHLCLDCAWEVFGEPRWHIPKARQGPLQPFANIDGSWSGAWGHSQTVQCTDTQASKNAVPISCSSL